MVWLEPKAHREIQKELFWGWAPDARARLEDFLRGSAGGRVQSCG